MSRTSIWACTRQSEGRITSGETVFEFVQRHPEMNDVREFVDVTLGQLPSDAKRLEAIQRIKTSREHQFLDVVFELFIMSHVIDCEFVVADCDGPDVYVPGEFAVEVTLCHQPRHKSSKSETAILDELRDRLDVGDPLGAIFALSSDGHLENSDGISPKRLEAEVRRQVKVFLATGARQQGYLRPDEEWRNRWQYTGPVADCLYESDTWRLWISWMARTTEGRGGIGAWPGVTFVGKRWQDGFKRKLKAKAQQADKWNLDVPVYLAVGFGGFFDADEHDAVQEVWSETESGKRFCGLWVTNFVLSPQLGNPALSLIPPMQGKAPSETRLTIPRLNAEIKSGV